MYHIIVSEQNLQGKKAELLEQVKQTLIHANRSFSVHISKYPTHATEIAKRLTSDLSTDISLVAMGGDGTLHEVLNGIQNFEHVSLGLIPFGTGNDFAESVQLPLTMKEATHVIAFRAPTPVDYIELNNGLRSINAVGMGLDVDVLKRSYQSKSKSRTKYFRSLLSTLLHFKKQTLFIEYGDTQIQKDCLLACLGNGKQIGGGMKLFPNAKVDDGKAELILVDYLSFWRTLHALIQLMRGKVHTLKEVTTLSLDEVKITPKDPEFTIQAEGELYDNVPLHAKVVSGKLKFYLP